MVVHCKNLWNPTISLKNKQKNVVVIVGRENEESQPSTARHATRRWRAQKGVRARRSAVPVTSTKARRGRPPVTEKG